MKKGILFIVLVFIFISCRTVYSVHKKAADRYKRKMHTVSHKKRYKGLHTPHPYVSGKVAQEKDSVYSFHHYITVATTNNIPPLIKSYVDLNGLPYPQYFIMRSAELTNFLNSPQPSEYLHIYLSINNATSSVDLIISGANKDTSSADSYSYTDIAPFTDLVFGNFVSSSICGVKRDPYIEGSYTYSAYPPINLPANVVPKISTGTASLNINHYEQSFNQFALAYSFLIDNSYLLSFLTNTNNQYNIAHHLHEADFPVEYIQIYFAYENANPDSSTVILVGLDGEGNHVYYTDGNSLYVFNTSSPCPYCNVNPSLLFPVIKQ